MLLRACLSSPQLVPQQQTLTMFCSHTCGTASSVARMEDHPQRLSNARSVDSSPRTTARSSFVAFQSTPFSKNENPIQAAGVAANPPKVRYTSVRKPPRRALQSTSALNTTGSKHPPQTVTPKRRPPVANPPNHVTRSPPKETKLSIEWHRSTAQTETHASSSFEPPTASSSLNKL